MKNPIKMLLMCAVCTSHIESGRAFLDPLSLATGVAQNLAGSFMGDLSKDSKEEPKEKPPPPPKEEPSEVLLAALEDIEEQEKRDALLGSGGQTEVLLQNTLVKTQPKKVYLAKGKIKAYEALKRHTYKKDPPHKLLQKAFEKP